MRKAKAKYDDQRFVKKKRNKRGEIQQNLTDSTNLQTITYNLQVTSYNRESETETKSVAQLVEMTTLLLLKGKQTDYF